MTTWALALVSLAILFAIAFPLVGLYLFSSDRARNVKQAEAQSSISVERVSNFRITHPEIVHLDRVDRHPVYVFLNMAFLTFGFSVTFIELPYKAFGSEALGTQQTLGFSLLLGSAMTLLGSLLGTHLGGRCIGRWVCDNVTSSTLGDDIRIPYLLAWWGWCSLAISMGFYGYTVVATVGWHRLLTTLGGQMCFATALMCLAMIPLLIMRIRRYIRERELLIEVALGIIRATSARA